ncbi:MAG: hypothetical protein IT285_09495 [Bdellovibrionales bacterium]|nr:hypothetical protein [Bdellovibrionales bacterium]
MSRFPAPGQERELIPGGPSMVHRGRALEVRFRPGQDHSGLTAHYDAEGRLERTEERDAGGRLTEIRRFGSPAETVRFNPRSGRESEWERYEPTAGGKTRWVHERLDPATGRRTKVKEKLLDSAQSCRTTGPTAETDLAKAVDEAICKAEEETTTCDAGRLSSWSDSSPASVTPAGPLCVDNACLQERQISSGVQGCTWISETEACQGANRAPFMARNRATCESPNASMTFAHPVNCFRRTAIGPQLQTIVQEVLFQGATCMAGMATTGTAATRRARLTAAGEGSISKAEAGALSADGALPLRNAALLLALYGQGPHFGEMWNASQQRGGVDGTDLDIGVERLSKAQASTRFSGSNGPISVACGSRVLSTGSDSRVRVLAAAPLPGNSGWPVLILNTPLNPDDLRPGTPENGKLRSVIFHEMMHLIGYPHDEGVLPVHTACQHACFPTESVSRHPRRAQRCPASLADSTQALNREICGGGLGASPSSTAFRNRQKAYINGNCACYFTGNPHDPNTVCN